MHQPWLGKLRPGDLILWTLLAVACGWSALRLPAEPALRGPLLFHLGLWLGFSLILALAIRGWLPGSSLVRVLVEFVLVGILYTSLGKLGFQLHAGSFDAALLAADRWLWGVDPTLALLPHVTVGRTELMSAVYLGYIAYLYLSILLECLALEPGAREPFLCGVTLLYCLGYLGYLCVPAHGPLALHPAPLPGGPIAAVCQKMVAGAGGALGAFPSLHVGGALFLSLFDLRFHPVRGMTYLPMVALIPLSTCYLRYHYTVDWLAGAACAGFALWATPRILQRWPKPVAA